MSEVSAVNSVQKSKEKSGLDNSLPKFLKTAEETETKATSNPKDEFIPSGKQEQTGYPRIAGRKDYDKKSGNESGKKTSGNSKELTDSEQREIDNLKKIDSKTRSHEAAHIAAGGGLVRGGANYSYQKGPDGKSYAVGGEVQIDISPEEDPDDTIQKMNRVRSAAMAPADPSGQDRQVASKAAQIQAQARSEKLQQSSQEPQSGGTIELPQTAPEEPTEQASTNSQLNSEKIINTYKKNESSSGSVIGEIIDFSISRFNIQKLNDV
jgi:hypothetical protein